MQYDVQLGISVLFTCLTIFLVHVRCVELLIDTGTEGAELEGQHADGEFKASHIRKKATFRRSDDGLVQHITDTRLVALMDLNC